MAQHGRKATSTSQIFLINDRCVWKINNGDDPADRFLHKKAILLHSFLSSEKGRRTRTTRHLPTLPTPPHRPNQSKKANTQLQIVCKLECWVHIIYTFRYNTILIKIYLEDRFIYFIAKLSSRQRSAGTIILCISWSHSYHLSSS